MTKWETPPEAVWVWGKYGKYAETYCHAEEIKQEEFDVPVTKYVRADLYAARVRAEADAGQPVSTAGGGDA